MTPGKQYIIFIHTPGRAQKDRHTRLKGSSGTRPPPMPHHVLPFKTMPSLTLGFLSPLSVIRKLVQNLVQSWSDVVFWSQNKHVPIWLIPRRSFTLKRYFPSSCWAHKCIDMAVVTIHCVTKLNNLSFLGVLLFPVRNHLSLWRPYNVLRQGTRALNSSACATLSLLETLLPLRLGSVVDHPTATLWQCSAAFFFFSSQSFPNYELLMYSRTIIPSCTTLISSFWM